MSEQSLDHGVVVGVTPRQPEIVIRRAARLARVGRLADALDAEPIVVGSRSGARASMREYFSGSVAVHLAHQHHRLVVIVPLGAQAEAPPPLEET